MSASFIVKENWLTRKPNPYAASVTAVLALLLYCAGLAYLSGAFGADDWMPATRELVYAKHEFWRAWTTLFAHGDLGHLLSNSLLFFPLAYLLTGYYGAIFFPIVGLALGGVTNLIVLQTLPAHVSLIGISGVVNWMGAAWITLFLLVDRREKLRRRFGIALFLVMFLFVPDTYKPGISYLSHFVGFVLGVLSALSLYAVRRSKFEAAEVIEQLPQEDGWDLDWSGSGSGSGENERDEWRERNSGSQDSQEKFGPPLRCAYSFCGENPSS